MKVWCCWFKFKTKVQLKICSQLCNFFVAQWNSFAKLLECKQRGMMNRFKRCEGNSDFFLFGCWRKVYDLFTETKSEERNESTEADMKIRKMVCYLIIIRFYGLEKFNKRREWKERRQSSIKNDFHERWGGKLKNKRRRWRDIGQVEISILKKVPWSIRPGGNECSSFELFTLNYSHWACESFKSLNRTYLWRKKWNGSKYSFGMSWKNKNMKIHGIFRSEYSHFSIAN